MISMHGSISILPLVLERVIVADGVPIGRVHVEEEVEHLERVVKARALGRGLVEARDEKSEEP